MTRAQAIVGALKGAGIELAASLPDKWLAEVIDTLDADPAIRHVRVTREDEGAGICAGAYLGGRKAVLVCQNAGLLLSANALAGFAHHHQVPFLVLSAYRGSHDDAYYYQVYKGRVTVPVLQAIGLPYHVLTGPEDFHLIGEAAYQAFLARMPVVLLMTRRALEDDQGGP